jgi:peptidoglycan/LPS O-acetylase OafA/YrhL
MQPWSRLEKKSMFWSLVPFFIQRPLGWTDRTLPNVSPTSYVNGLRGVACVIVLHQHIAGSEGEWILRAYGTHEKDVYLLQLPYFRLLHSGMFMVALFFVISGFALSYSPLKKINMPSDPSRDSALLRNLSSSLFRRPLRLFTPMMAAIMLNSIVTYIYPNFGLGLWRKGNPSFFQHLKTVMLITWPSLNAYSWGYYWPRGFSHGWTLQMEYRGSIVIFILCLLTSQLTSGFRKVTLAFAALYALMCGRWEVFCFIEGMIIAELRITSPQPSSLPSRLPSPSILDDVEKLPADSNVDDDLDFLTNLCWFATISFALLIGGWPRDGASGSQPWKSLMAITPDSWIAKALRDSHGIDPELSQCFWISIGAGLLLLCLEASPRVQAVFNTKPLIYLGEISFSFYLLHQTVIFGLGRPYFYTLQRAGYSNLVAFCIEYAVVIAVLLLVSDIFWRLVDEKVVKGSRQFAKWCGM